MFGRRAFAVVLAPIAFFTACTSDSNTQETTTLNVYAASSLATPFELAGLAFEKLIPE